MKFLTDINLNKNELQNAVIQNLSTAPDNPKVGQVYYNTTDQLMYQYKRTSAAGVTPATYAWLSVGSPEQYFGTVTSITAGIGLVATANPITESGTIQVKPYDGIKVDSNGVSVDVGNGIELTGTSPNKKVAAKAYNGITVNSDGISVKPYDGIKVDSDGVSADIDTTQGLKFTGSTAGSKKIGIKYGQGLAFTASGEIVVLTDSNQGIDTEIDELTDNEKLIIKKGKGLSFDTSNTETKGNLDVEVGAGLTIDSNNAVAHSNSISAQSTQGIYPIAIDAQGHITGYGSVFSNPVNYTGTLTASHIPTWNNTTGTLNDSGKTITTTAPSGTSTNNTIPTSYAVASAISSAISGLGSVLNFKGTKATASELPSTGNTTGDVWIVTADNSEYVWTGTAWEKLGPTIDLSGYLEKSGGTMTGSITMTNSSTITGVPTPTNNSDAANKGYVDSAVGAIDVGVTSVALANATNGGLSISGSPITSSGTITVGLDTGYGDTKNPYGSKTKNYVLAAPSNANGVPTFRALVAADIPDLSGAYKPLQTAKTSPTASGNTTAFIDTISQDANGVITATKKNVDFSDYLKKDGTVAMTGNLNLNSHRIINVTDPESAQDAATKNYVDNVVSTATGGAVFKQTPVPTNPALTASGGAFTWTISSNLEDMIVSVYEIATGSLVYPDISISGSTITIIINDSASVGSLAADTYRAVILGTMPSNDSFGDGAIADEYEP